MKDSDQNKNAGVFFDSGSQYEYRYRTMSIAHFPQLEEDIDRLRQKGLLSDAETFQGYLRGMKFSPTDNFPDAQSVIILAIFTKPMLVHFQFNGTRVPAAVPPNYYDAGWTRETLSGEIKSHIIGEAGYRIEDVSHRLHLKLLAVRSGLGRYGRNNICYVDGMGSFLNLRAYLTDYRFEENNWHEVQTMELCRNCTICMKQCPGGAIRPDQFVINVKRCIPLYNEIGGILPDWIPADAHHAFLGCMKCQWLCPANREPIKRIEQIEDITEEETRQFVSGRPEKNVILAVSQS